MSGSGGGIPAGAGDGCGLKVGEEDGLMERLGETPPEPSRPREPLFVRLLVGGGECRD